MSQDGLLPHSGDTKWFPFSGKPDLALQTVLLVQGDREPGLVHQRSDTQGRGIKTKAFLSGLSLYQRTRTNGLMSLSQSKTADPLQAGKQAALFPSRDLGS